MHPRHNITEAITGITPFPEPETVFSPEQPWLAKHFLPLVSIDLGLLRGELAGTVVHIVNPFEPYEGVIGGYTAAHHNPHIGAGWLAFHLDEHNRYRLPTDEGYFLFDNAYHQPDAQTARYAAEEFTQSRADYQECKARFQATGKLQPPNYSGTHSFIEQLGGAIWYGNWTDGLTAPAAYALDFDESITDDNDPNGNIRISRDGKPFFQAAAVPAYHYGCNGADWLILFYEPASRAALIMQEWT